MAKEKPVKFHRVFIKIRIIAELLTAFLRESCGI
jgi:hypothetical protein